MTPFRRRPRAWLPTVRAAERHAASRVHQRRPGEHRTTGLHRRRAGHPVHPAGPRVLGYRLAGGEAADLAAQLPGDLGELLPADGFDLEDFYRRVADDEGVTRAQARQHARAVIAAVEVGISGGEIENLSAQLPAEYADLLQTEPVQHR